MNRNKTLKEMREDSCLVKKLNFKKFKSLQMNYMQELRIRRLLELSSIDGKVLMDIDSSEVCHRFEDLLKIEKLDLNSKSTLYNLIRYLKKLDILREIKSENNEIKLLFNPWYTVRVKYGPTKEQIQIFGNEPILED